MNNQTNVSPSTERLFHQMKTDERVAVFVICVMCLPVEEYDYNSIENESIDTKQTVWISWNKRVMRVLAQEMEVPDSYVQAYKSLVRRSYEEDMAHTYKAVSPFLDIIQSSGINCVDTVAKIAITLLLNSCYDSKGRVLLRRVRNMLNVSRMEYCHIEVHMVESLHSIGDAIQRSEAENKPNSYVRYAKIGATGLAAGGIIAVTGGMAAPAVAAAFLLLGGSTAVAAAALSTTAVMASIFGTVGGGLATYKMSRRTKGITDFEFESHGKQGKAAVMVMVSGWVLHKEDYKRTFGIVPDTMSLEERLVRFYQIHCKDRVGKAKEEAKKWKNNEDELLDQMTEFYGVDPRLVSTLTPPEKDLDPVIDEDEAKRLFECVENLLFRDAIAHGKTKKQSEAASEEKQSESVSSRPHEQGSKATDKAESGQRGGMGNTISDIRQSLTRGFGSMLHTVTPGQSSQGAKAKRDDKKPTSASTQSASTPLPSRPTNLATSDLTTGCEDADRGEFADEKQAEQVEGHAEAIESVAVNEGLVEEGHVESVRNETQRSLEGNFWHWNSTDLSRVYELNLLRWEIDMQVELGNSLMTLLSSLKEKAITAILNTTVMAGLIAAVALPYSLIKLTDVIDRTWTIAIERADMAGVELARALVQRPQGSRAVTLVGHSLGARVIFSCLRELAKYKARTVDPNSRVGKGRMEIVTDEIGKFGVNVGHAIGDVGHKIGEMGGGLLYGHSSKGKNTNELPADSKSVPPEQQSKDEHRYADSIVQDVVLLGGPIGVNATSWREARSVVAGRLVNGYSKRDYCLALIYRYENVRVLVAGVQEVAVDGVENIDMSSIVAKHTDYSLRMKEVLEMVDLLSPPDPANVYSSARKSADKPADQSAGENAKEESRDSADMSTSDLSSV